MTIAYRSFPRGAAVDYGSFRDNIEPGDILLCSGSGWFSQMIQKGTKSIWSHVGFVMRLKEIDRVMVLESVEPLGVRTVPLSKYLKDYDSNGNAYPGGLVLARHREFAQKATPARMKKFGQFAVELFGYPYDKDEIAKIATRIASSYLPFSAQQRKNLKPDREFICSEYAYECYKHVGIRIEHDRRGFIAPADFARAGEVRLKAILKEKP